MLLRWLLACCIGLDKWAGFCAWEGDEDRIETLLLAALGVICRRRLAQVWCHCLQLGQSGAFKPPHRPISKTATGFGESAAWGPTRSTGSSCF